jgi:hypothetical protein
MTAPTTEAKAHTIDGGRPWPADLTKQERCHLATLVNRRDYLARVLAPLPPGAPNTSYRRRELEALTWAIDELVNAELVDA